MKKKNGMHIGSLVVLVATLAVGCAHAQEERLPEWAQKADVLAEKLKPFVPEPVAGLIDHMPWESEGSGTQSGSAAVCTEVNPVCFVYVEYYAGRVWHFDDPALAKQVEDTQKEADALLERQKKFLESPEGAEAKEASERNQEALGKASDKYSAEMEKLVEKFSDPNLSDNERQRLGAQIKELQRKMQQAQKAQQATQAQAPQSAFMEEAKKLDKRMADLKARARNLRFELRGNSIEGPLWCFGMSGKPVRSGTLKGHTLYRWAEHVASYEHPERVCLAVYLGAEGFKNPIIKRGEVVRPELKTILVMAEVESFPQSAKADEAAARQILEKVHYDGLAKLLQP